MPLLICCRLSWDSKAVCAFFFVFFLPSLRSDNTFGFNKYSKSDSYQIRCGKLSICALESVTGSEMRRGKAVIRDPSCFDLCHLIHLWEGPAVAQRNTSSISLTPKCLQGSKICVRSQIHGFFYLFFLIPECK